MSSAVKTMQLQMERLQEEMANTLNTEKIRKTRKHERAHLAKPNMEFMKGVLDKTSALREYYDAEDPTTHWLNAEPACVARRGVFSRGGGGKYHTSQHAHPDIIEFRERTASFQLELQSKYGGALPAAERSRLAKERAKLQLEEQEILERAKQEYNNITTLHGRTPPPQLLGIAPTETDIKFLESVYNMFNIQSEQIKALEAEIQELKKDK